MSTRSAIARPIPSRPASFLGVYHHWDGYPSGLGASLFELYRTAFNRDLDKMLHTLIDEHPAGWSTINGADFSKAPGFVNRHGEDVLCVTCGEPQWKHYAQYYESHGLPKPVTPPDNSQVLGHACEVPEDNSPQCYCHGARKEDANAITEDNASGCGCEWVYLLDRAPDGKARMQVLSSFCSPAGKFAGQKMIGMFGMGDPDAVWNVVGLVDLDNDEEPQWDLFQ